MMPLHRASAFFFFHKHRHYWTIERLDWERLRRQQIKYIDRSDNNPEGIQAWNGNDWKAFHRVVGPAAFEVRKKVNGGAGSLAFGGKKGNRKRLHSTFL